MRMNEKGFISHDVQNQLFGVDFHDFIQMEQVATPVELASEFGLNLREVQKLRKHLSKT